MTQDTPKQEETESRLNVRLLEGSESDPERLETPIGRTPSPPLAACSRFRASSTSCLASVVAIDQPTPVLGRAKPGPWDAAAEGAEHGGGIEKAGPGRDIGDVGNPQRCRVERGGTFQSVPDQT